MSSAVRLERMTKNYGKNRGVAELDLEVERLRRRRSDHGSTVADDRV